ncbi:hypothetical protein A3J20_05340 [Candidatus Gottesmanbacteria bacterium RIFCSPLOWO2_02_FULL_42_29]|uniref:ABC transmembrane type-1 domain-containing protein n=2 Tax=Candidatus Gottesmaniibacteriota TaxID=1752720 RepID=A0A1F6BG13_9BACT|nr:MAG: Binding-protein-dependent transport system inner membrane component [Candidatus Gottesmanbacteria bacterium GW2011_GWA2_42_18]OGG12350.1 MAG: hypothetical protein A2781_00590 [Candidatus Gottesmanbacteria bacterium RIFCSPHIGHO2_01_FULL_42_27]OGG19306.1 MAG: hypothetical protein A3E72_02735 [Candidatus Gottesmanbacteria bacterium RIFCSPHIGHO2_12_FULL_43_26]OGG35457.1 MAG: hypothetical protein A2968_00665 [Candidatus Gottesmanbacteria bacterium RIFCSPLOWO2_01_FULL_42_22]OGG39167.1 MAG: hy
MNKYYFPAVFFSFLLIIWEILVNLLRIEVWLLPAPSKIVLSFWNSGHLLWLHTGRTLTEAIAGLIAGTVFGFLLAVTMEFSQLFKKMLYPLLLISQTVPFIVVAPLLVIWFGFGISAKLILIAVVCFFPVAINMKEGLESADKNLLKLVRSLGGSRWKIFRLVKLPASLPYFFSGLRISAAYAVLTAVISEWIGSDRGLGILLIRSSKSFQTDRVFAIIIFISFLSLILIRLIDVLGRNLIPWHYRILDDEKNR